MSAQVAEVLRNGLKAFGPNGEKWAQGFASYSGNKEKCCVATCFNRVHYSHHSSEALELLGKLCDLPGDVGRWNDAPERTFADVKALFEKAIQLAEAA
jgi:hypothetical protein